MKFRHYMLLVALASCLALGSARADVVHLKQGGRIEGKVEDLGESVKVVTKYGTFTLKKSEVKEIERKLLPEEEYQERLIALAPDDAQGHLELAKWCRAHRLRKEYAELLQKAVQLDPTNAEATQLWYEYEKRELKLPVSEGKAERLLAELGEGFKTLRSAHYLICYNSDETFAKQRAYLFEKIYKTFYSFFESKGLALTPLRERLVAILFDSRDNFLKHAQSVGVWLEHTEGYYSSATNRAVFYNLLNRPQHARVRAQMEAISRRLTGLSAQIRRTSPRARITLQYEDGRRVTLSRSQALQHVARDKKELEKLNKEMLRFYQNENASVTVHEVTHQLWFNSGLADRRRWYPRWLGEGVGIFFETAYRDDWVASRYANTNRLQQYLQLKSQGKLLSLQELLLTDDAFMQPGDRQLAAYAQSWALFHFLATKHSQGLRYYIMSLSRRQPTIPAKEENLALFKASFGANLESVQRELAAHVSQLQTTSAR